MKKIKKKILFVLTLILLFFYQTIMAQKSKNSILIFKSNSIEDFKIISKDNIQSKTSKIINYHLINFKSKEVLLFYKPQGENWERKTFKFSSVTKKDGMIELEVNTEICHTIYFDVNPYNTIVYSYTNNTIFAFKELEKLSKNEFQKIGIYDFNKVETNDNYTKKLYFSEIIKDFEYSEYWRKEAFKKSIVYLNQLLSNRKNKCKMISRNTYSPNIVKYIGVQGFNIKIYTKYDCNENFINEAYFWIDAYYLGNGKWNIEMIDQKLTY